MRKKNQASSFRPVHESSRTPGGEDVVPTRALMPRRRRRQLVTVALETLADRLPLALAITDRGLRPLFLNETGTALLELGTVLHWDGDALARSDPSQTETVRRCVGNACDSEEKLPTVLALPRSEQKDAAAQFVVIPVRTPEAPSKPAQVALLAIREAGRALPKLELSLQSHYRLTGRESRVVAALTSGLSLADVARMLAITPGTVRGHLKGAFRKTGTHRQTQLVQQVLVGLVLALFTL